MGFYNRYSLFAGYSNCRCRNNEYWQDDYCQYDDCDYDEKHGGYGKGDNCDKYGHDDYDDEKDYDCFKREGRREPPRKERCGCIPWQGKCRNINDRHNGGYHCEKDRQHRTRKRCCPICDFFSMFCCK